LDLEDDRQFRSHRSATRLRHCTEEEQTGIFDRSDAAYPILARMLATRRDNIKDTITALEQRLSKLDQASWSLI
jgi:hypothetical protein